MVYGNAVVAVMADVEVEVVYAYVVRDSEGCVCGVCDDAMAVAKAEEGEEGAARTAAAAPEGRTSSSCKR